MTPSKLAICVIANIIFGSVLMRAHQQECNQQLIYEDAQHQSFDPTQSCRHHLYDIGDLSEDGCRVDCRRFSWFEVKAIDHKKPLACCIKENNRTGVCSNGRCHSSSRKLNQSTLSNYRRLVIKAVDFMMNREGLATPEKMRIKMIYVKPAADRAGSYYNDEIMCTSDFIQVRPVTDSHYLVKFDLVCKTLLVHKDASIKFVAEDGLEPESSISFQGQEQLSNLKLGSLVLRSEELESEFDALKYEIEVLPSSD